MTNVAATPLASFDKLKRLIGLTRAHEPNQAEWLASPNWSLDAPESPVISAARSLPHGAVCGDDLRRAIDAEIHGRRAAANMLDGPASPATTGELTVRRDGLPDWWVEKGNLLLCAPDVEDVKLSPGFLEDPSHRALVVVGRGARPGMISLSKTKALAVIGDNVLFDSTSTSVSDGTMLIGAHTSATWAARLDCRNGGIVVIGADCMLAGHVNIMTDDCHAIRDAATGARINRFGGRIMIEDHVWLGEQSRLMGDCRIGRDSIIGTESLVKSMVLPPNTVSAGRPARLVRSDVTWTREDIP